MRPSSLQIDLALLYLEAAQKAEAIERSQYLRQAAELITSAEFQNQEREYPTLAAVTRCWHAFETGNFKDVIAWGAKAKGTEFDRKIERFIAFAAADNGENPLLSPDISKISSLIWILTLDLKYAHDEKEKHEILVKRGILQGKANLLQEAASDFLNARNLQPDSAQPNYMLGILSLYKEFQKGTKDSEVRIPIELTRAYSLGHKSLALGRYPIPKESFEFFNFLANIHGNLDPLGARHLEYLQKGIKAAHQFENPQEGPHGENTLYRLAKKYFTEAEAPELPAARRNACLRIVLHLAATARSVNKNHYDIAPSFRELMIASLRRLASGGDNGFREVIERFAEADRRFDSSPIAYNFPVKISSRKPIAKSRWSLFSKERFPPVTWKGSANPKLATVIIYSNSGVKAGSFIADEGWILTCAHGFPAQAAFHAVFVAMESDGSLFFTDSDLEVEWLDHYSKSDYAVCRLKGFSDKETCLAGLEHLVFRFGDGNPAVGDTVVLIGHPGKDETGEHADNSRDLSYSSVSGKVLTPPQNSIQEVDCYIRGGFSGGPTVTEHNPYTIAGMSAASGDDPFGTGNISPASEIHRGVKVNFQGVQFEKWVGSFSLSGVLRRGGVQELSAGFYEIDSPIRLEHNVSVVGRKLGKRQTSVGVTSSGKFVCNCSVAFDGIIIASSGNRGALFELHDESQLTMKNCVVFSDEVIVQFNGSSHGVLENCLLISRTANFRSFDDGPNLTLKNCVCISLEQSVVEIFGSGTTEIEGGEFLAKGHLFLQDEGKFLDKGKSVSWQGNGHFGRFGKVLNHQIAEDGSMVWGSTGKGTFSIIPGRIDSTYFNYPFRQRELDSVATDSRSPSVVEPLAEPRGDYFIVPGSKHGPVLVFSEAYDLALSSGVRKIEVYGAAGKQGENRSGDRELREPLLVTAGTDGSAATSKFSLDCNIIVLGGYLTVENVGIENLNGVSCDLTVNEGFAEFKRGAIISGVNISCFASGNLVASGCFFRNLKTPILVDGGKLNFRKCEVSWSSRDGIIAVNQCTLELRATRIYGCGGVGLRVTGGRTVLIKRLEGESADTNCVFSQNRMGGLDVSLSTCVVVPQVEVAAKKQSWIFSLVGRLFAKFRSVPPAESQTPKEDFNCEIDGIFARKNGQFGVRLTGGAAALTQNDSTANDGPGFEIRGVQLKGQIQLSSRGNHGPGIILDECNARAGAVSGTFLATFNGGDGIAMSNMRFYGELVSVGNFGHGCLLENAVFHSSRQEAATSFSLSQPSQTILAGNHGSGIHSRCFGGYSLNEGYIVFNGAGGAVLQETKWWNCSDFLSQIYSCAVCLNSKSGVDLGNHRHLDMKGNLIFANEASISIASLSVASRCGNFGFLSISKIL